MPTPSDPLYPVSHVAQSETRVCKNCLVPKFLEDFIGKRGIICSSCRAGVIKQWVKINRDRLVQRSLATDPSKIRVCSKCGTPKPLKDFYKNATSREGYHTECKVCTDKRKREWDNDNRERVNENKRNNPKTKIRYEEWRKKNPNYMSENGKEWREANPEHVRRKHIEKRFRNYGVTPEWYDKQIALRGGKCAICGSTDPKNQYNTFHVDHYHGCCSKSCHACDNCRRGLLCGPCNTALGILEKVEWKRKAIAYLNKYSKKPSIDPDQGSLFDF